MLIEFRDWLSREYLIKIGGTSKNFLHMHLVQSLSFETNLRKHEANGPTNGTRFDFNTKDKVIVGFHGRNGLSIDAIGVYFKTFRDVFGEKVRTPTYS